VLFAGVVPHTGADVEKTTARGNRLYIIPHVVSVIAEASAELVIQNIALETIWDADILVAVIAFPVVFGIQIIQVTAVIIRSLLVICRPAATVPVIHFVAPELFAPCLKHS
jgi:hypothetical protein